MLRKILDLQLRLTEEDKPLRFLRPLATALDTFFYEVPIRTKRGPHIRDAVDLKRWMILVVFALIPCAIMAVWNTGVQKLIFQTGDLAQMDAFLKASESLSGYFGFCFSAGRFWSILRYGLETFIPILIISYAVGGFWEGVFAYFRRHEISEGFLVTGILYALILPPTLPYWMAAVGISVGIVLSKEVFGGTGMNILNPALVCRTFLFFAYPAYMTGTIWAGTDQFVVQKNLTEMNREANRPAYDAYSQATPLGKLNIPLDIKRIHIDALASRFDSSPKLTPVLRRHLAKWNKERGAKHGLTTMDTETLRSFITSDIAQGGLGLPPDSFGAAYEFAAVRFGTTPYTFWNFFLGNRLGSMGETSVLAALLGAALLLATGIASWRTMVAMALGAFAAALLFEWGASLGYDTGAWNPAKFDLPAYKHLVMGGFAFGLVFMATDPVSSPDMKLSHCIYGALIGMLTIFIRNVNPAFPEGVMLAILFANVFGPLIDSYSIQHFRKVRRVRAKKALQ